MDTLGIIFFIIAWLYASVGFGGGSSYLAMMVLADLPLAQIPIISLICNIIVTSSGFFYFYRDGHFNWTPFLYLILGSIPMAFLGALIPIHISHLSFLLGLVLCLSSLFLFIRKPSSYRTILPAPWALSLLGAGIGFLSGLVGIGGGIFLSPIMLNLSWFGPKQVAALCSGFILVNSGVGLLGQMTKLSRMDISACWPLFIGVFFGGQAGAIIGSRIFPVSLIRFLTAVLTLYAGSKLIGQMEWDLKKFTQKLVIMERHSLPTEAR
ncbi:MAG: sulfite exporter TauE/SafE family protein [Oligoflexales bacterium]|nr:sulfite exporter TauE/SafE family protein [Oligoflexales bacterium]